MTDHHDQTPGSETTRTIYRYRGLEFFCDGDGGGDGDGDDNAIVVVDGDGSGMTWKRTAQTSQ